jgi:hypothetical protein
LDALLPGVVDDLRARDARVIHTTEVRFHIAGGSLLLDDTDLEIVGATRPLLESVVRDRVRAQPGVLFLEDHDARGLLTTPDRSRVVGVRLGSRDANAVETLAADLVVDATGRSSRSPRWVSDLGYPSPDEERLQVGVHYTTRLFRRRPGDLEGCQHVVVAIPPDGRRGGVLLAVEGDRWIVTLVGLLGERPPADLDGFVGYARTLWAGDLHEVVATAEPLGEVLDQHGLDRVGPRFFQRTNRTMDAAWTMATGADLGYPAVQGPRTARWRLINAYVNRLLRVAHHDPLVAKAFMEVSGMVSPPQHLMRPRIVSRVFTGGRGPARKSIGVSLENAPGARQ